MPVLILGGMRSGWFTPTKASVVAVFYALIVGKYWYRTPGMEGRARHLGAIRHVDRISADHHWHVGLVCIGVTHRRRSASGGELGRVDEPERLDLSDCYQYLLVAVRHFH